MKLTESQLKKIISESTKKIISEISWQKAQDAADMAECNGWFEDVLSKIEDALMSFDDDFDTFNSWYGTGGRIQKNSGTMKYFESTSKVREFRERLQNLYDEMKAYNDRKIKQQDNLSNMADQKFKDAHNGMNRHDFEETFPEDDENLTPEQEEYNNYVYGR